jgi:hypothetical protein
MGPLVHDVAIAVVGCCYSASTNTLDMDRLRGLLQGLVHFVSTRVVAHFEWCITSGYLTGVLVLQLHVASILVARRSDSASAVHEGTRAPSKQSITTRTTPHYTPHYTHLRSIAFVYFREPHLQLHFFVFGNSTFDIRS